MQGNKELVERLVSQVINGDDLAALDDICTPRLARKLRAWFAPFRAAFPDWWQEVVQLVAEGDTVVARFVCRGTNEGGVARRAAHGPVHGGRRGVLLHCLDGRLDGAWGLEETWARLRQLGTVEQAMKGLRREGHQRPSHPIQPS